MVMKEHVIQCSSDAHWWVLIVLDHSGALHLRGRRDCDRYIKQDHFIVGVALRVEWSEEKCVRKILNITSLGGESLMISRQWSWLQHTPEGTDSSNSFHTCIHINNRFTPVLSHTLAGNHSEVFSGRRNTCRILSSPEGFFFQRTPPLPQIWTWWDQADLMAPYWSRGRDSKDPHK